MARTNRPVVSIGLPVYNGENFLADALGSLLDQTFSAFEIIVSDNASTDTTREIVASFMADDDRVRYVRNEHNLGANPNYNRTFALARGEFFRWHAHDDRCDPKYLELCLDVIERDPQVSLVHCTTGYIDRNGDPLVALRNGFLDPDGFIERLVQDDDAVPMLGSTYPHVRLDAIANRMSVFFDIFGLMRTADVRRTMLLPNYYGADKVFLAEMALKGRIVRIPDEVFHRRCHAKASTRSLGFRSLAGWSDASRGFDYYPALIIKGYLEAIDASSLAPSEKRRCRRVLLKKLRSPYKLIRGR
jgi:glycosyltransferase involved in cell wall biosynthesis